MASKHDAGQNLGFEPEARCPSGTGLLLFDLDDTIVEAGSYVSKRVFDALSAAHKAGYVLSVASGRPLCMVSPKVLGTGAFDYCVCSNGASVVCLADSSSVTEQLMTQEDAWSCYRMLSSFRPAWNAFFGGRSYFEVKGASYMLTGRTGATARALRSGSTRRAGIARLAWTVWRGARFLWSVVLNTRQRQVFSLSRHLRRATCGVEKIGCSIPDADSCAKAAQILRNDGRFEVIQMGPFELEITARGVTKGTGAKALMEVLGIDRSRAVAFGDSGNDLPLADAVGWFVAVGNADAEVKEAADEVCPPIGEDGVAVWIEHMLAERS